MFFPKKCVYCHANSIQIMLPVRKIAALFLLWAGITGCQKDTWGGQLSEQRHLTVLFSPGASFSGAGYDDTILKAVMESVAGNSQIKYHLLRPQTPDQARSLAQEWQGSAGENSALLLCGPEYNALASTLSPEKGRVLLLDSRQTFENGVSTLQLKRYGGAYLAGAMCVDFPKMWIFKALDGDRMMDTVAGGIADGYSATANQVAQVLVLSDSYQGTNMPDELFAHLYENRSDMGIDGDTMLVPVCGASRMGAYMFSNNMYFLSMGVGEDCSIFSNVLPFSLVYDLGGIVKDYIGHWLEGEPWPAHQDFGFSTGHVYIQYNPRYFERIPRYVNPIGFLLAGSCLFTQEQYMEWEARYRPIALEQEASHAY